MKKILILCTILIVVFNISSCGSEKVQNVSNREEGSNSEEEKEQSVVINNYAGECGYITDNLIFDYSEVYNTVYEWCDGVKLPFDKPEGATIVWQDRAETQYATICIEDVPREEMEEYTKELEMDGYELCCDEDSYYLLKDNLSVSFSYEKNRDRYTLWCYMGNVIGERAVTAADARKLIDSQGLIERVGAFEDYFVLEIQSETVAEAGYYEFIITPTKPKEGNVDLNMPYYLLTDGENVLLFEQNVLSLRVPTNVNLLKTDNKEELIVSGIPMSEDYDSYALYARGYELKDGKFVKTWEYTDWPTAPIYMWQQAVVSQIEDGEVKFYLLEIEKGYDHSLGRKGFWKVKEEYFIEKSYVD